MEQTNIEIVADESRDKEEVEKQSVKEDIFLFKKDEGYNAEFVIVLDKEWFGLLSSIMLGVEEKSNNEITRDLLKKFYDDLHKALAPKLKELGIEPSEGSVEVLTQAQLLQKLGHSEYFHVKMEIDGLADHKVRAEIFAGNPEKILKAEEPEAEEPEAKAETEVVPDSNQSPAATKTSFQEGNNENAGHEDSHSTISQENVISAKSVEFESFLEQPVSVGNGSARSMDLLIDVEMDVSVELGRIGLPLGKLLQLSKGSVIELEKLAGEPVDILVNGHIIAKGEVVVIDEHFGVRISSLVTTRQRLSELS
ncbi:MAG: flagellar motor switch protein FliN [Balneolia bacterium]|nr:flagellar motor switch protein FliN [Balneolia bacterium]